MPRGWRRQSWDQVLQIRSGGRASPAFLVLRGAVVAIGLRGCLLGRLWSLPTLPPFLGDPCGWLTAGITAQVYSLRWAASVKPISQMGKSELHVVKRLEWRDTPKSRLWDFRAWALSPAPHGLPSVLPPLLSGVLWHWCPSGLL